jgi:hypothetical protein
MWYCVYTMIQERSTLPAECCQWNHDSVGRHTCLWLCLICEYAVCRSQTHARHVRWRRGFPTPDCVRSPRWRQSPKMAERDWVGYARLVKVFLQLPVLRTWLSRECNLVSFKINLSIFPYYLYDEIHPYRNVILLEFPLQCILLVET